MIQITETKNDLLPNESLVRVTISPPCTYLCR